MRKKRMKKYILLIILMSVFTALGFVYSKTKDTKFADLGPQEMYDRIVKERDHAINEVKLAGNYRCCIDPPCTMCYMGANKWNNFTAGTCACDDFIARGEEPCPQCSRGLEQIHDEENIFCDIDANVATCDSKK